MDTKVIINNLRNALKLTTCVESEKKLTGLSQIDNILSEKEATLVALGYDKVLLEELLKLVKFEEDECLQLCLDIIDRNYSHIEENQDKIMENLLYRYGLSTNNNISLMLLEKISSLVDKMSDNIAKHSKQLLALTDITLPNKLSILVEAILNVTKEKLPTRKTVE